MQDSQTERKEALFIVFVARLFRPCSETHRVKEMKIGTLRSEDEG